MGRSSKILRLLPLVGTPLATAGVHAAVVAAVAPAVQIVRVGVGSGIVLHFVFLLTALAVHVVILIHNSNF